MFIYTILHILNHSVRILLEANSDFYEHNKFYTYQL